MLGRWLAGAVLGAVLTAAGLWLAPDGDATATVAGPVEVTTTLPVWIAEGEARFGNSVIIGRDLTQEGEQVRFEFDVASLAPGYDAVSDHDVVTAAPSVILAFLASGDAVEGALHSGSAGSVVFDLPAGATVDDVSSLRLTEWRVRVPMDVEIGLPSVQGASTALPDGSVIAVDTVLEQRNDTIIQFDYETPPDVWPEARRNFLPTVDFVGAGPGWRLAYASMGLTSGFQLTWGGPTAPEEIRIRVRVAPWVRMVADVEIPLPVERG